MDTETDGSEDGPSPIGRVMRADAKRNVASLIEAAKTVFDTSGVDAPVREIALQAGVGIGTLYRNFPKRSDLIAAVFRHEVDACMDLAPSLVEKFGPSEALAQWLLRYVDFIAFKRGISVALYSGDPAYEALPAYLHDRFDPLVGELIEAAIAAGEIGDGVDAHDLLHAVGSLSATPDGSGAKRARRMVGLLVDGLRYGSNPSASTSL